jgi:hypothetical protein
MPASERRTGHDRQRNRKHDQRRRENQSGQPHQTGSTVRNDPA